jgi:hypothetical protein
VLGDVAVEPRAVRRGRCVPVEVLRRPARGELAIEHLRVADRERRHDELHGGRVEAGGGHDRGHRGLALQIDEHVHVFLADQIQRAVVVVLVDRERPDLLQAVGVLELPECGRRAVIAAHAVLQHRPAAAVELLLAVDLEWRGLARRVAYPVHSRRQLREVQLGARARRIVLAPERGDRRTIGRRAIDGGVVDRRSIRDDRVGRRRASGDLATPDRDQRQPGHGQQNNTVRRRNAHSDPVTRSRANMI